MRGRNKSPFLRKRPSLEKQLIPSPLTRGLGIRALSTDANSRPAGNSLNIVRSLLELGFGVPVYLCIRFVMKCITAAPRSMS